MLNNIIDFNTIEKKPDLTNENHLKLITKIANLIVNNFKSIDELNSLENRYSSEKDKTPIVVNLAIKLAKSKYLINKLNKKVDISIVFAVYQEHNRILHSDLHPNGENFIEKKIEQLEWLFENSSDLISWKMFIVDDGCPDKSGLLAKKIIENRFSHYDIEVLFLENAINKSLPIVNNISNCGDSQKGGSINYGMCMASYENPKNNHIVIYTDADLSINLGQIGILIDEIINRDKLVAIGSRRDKNSVILKSSSRNLRGMFFIYLWKKLLPNLAYLNDTQCPLKAFRADIAQEIVHNNIESKFAFDIELLIKSELKEKNSISSNAIAMIDSEAESTTTKLSPYLNMLKTIVKLYREYLPQNNESSEIANFIDSLSENEWSNLVENIPKSNIGKSIDEFEYNFLK